MTLDEMLAEDIGGFYADPFGYVMYIFPWDTEPSIQLVKLKEPYASRFQCEWGPDTWACEFLDDLGREIRRRKFDGKTAVEPIRFSTASGHGIGKSTLVAWLIKFILDTRPFAKGVVTANTSDQLKTKTWAELAKWNSLSLTSHLWQYSSSRGSMSIYRKSDDEKIRTNWRCDAQTCREENSEAFQGLHAANSTPFFIFDEASGIPDKIFESRSGGATDGEPMWFDFGNPTRKSGMFYENCIGKYKHRFNVRSIDSRSVAITNKTLMKEWADDWGEDSDFFKVKVRGVFPSAGSVQFIDNDTVNMAARRPVIEDRHAQLVIGVDVARYGDNSTVIFPRIGNDARSFPFKEYKGLDTVQVVEKVAETIDMFRKLGKGCAGLFVDGGGLGAGVVDMLRRLGYNPIDVNFGGRAADQRFRFRSDEMWGRMKEGLNTLCINNHKGLIDQLTQREYGFTLAGNKIQLESKDDMKARGIASPDIADALALTYANTLSPVMEGIFPNKPLMTNYEFDPLEC